MWKDLSYNEKDSLSNRISAVCSMRDIKRLKEFLPTVQDLMEYRDVRNGGGILHTLMCAFDTREASSSVDFLKEILKAYDIENNPQLKEALFMKRNDKGKLAADFTYVEEYARPDIKKMFFDWRGKDASHMTDLTDKRTQGEKNKVELYLFIKDQVLSIKKESTKEQAHAIIKPYRDRSEESVDSFEKGTPVSGATYLAGDRGKLGPYMIGSVHEEYPELRLRNFKNEENKEDFCVLRGLRPDSKESLLSQVIDRIDFPEDYVPHFKALKVFEDDYKRLREDEGKMATYRYFTQNCGAVIFEGGQDETAKGNSKDENAKYAGYRCQRMHVDPENGNMRKYPIVVVDSTDISNQIMHDENRVNDWNNNERTLYHELFHEIDLGSGAHFSDTKMFKYAMMLAETDQNNKITTPFLTVNGYYPASQYNCEMAAQIMSLTDSGVLGASPLLQRIHRLGEYFAEAKANKNMKALDCWSIANNQDRRLEQIPERSYIAFMAAKTAGSPFLMDEQPRATYEKTLIRRMDETIVKMAQMLEKEPPFKIPTQEIFDNIKDFKDAVQVLKEYQLTEEQKKGIVHQMEERAKTYGIPSYAERMMGKIKELAEPSGKTKTTGTTIPTAYTR